VLLEAAAGADPFGQVLGWRNPDRLLLDDEAATCAMFARRLQDDTRNATWLARAVVERDTTTMVGHLGCHFAPDEHGVVEFGYLVAPSRRTGLTTEAVLGLAGACAASGAATTVRATVVATNDPSLGLLHHLGFVVVGNRTDADGQLEHLLECPVDAIGRFPARPEPEPSPSFTESP
jgi:RimJ/RimL family protein N-acetyltransferase